MRIEKNKKQNERRRLDRLNNPEKYRETDKKRWTGKRREKANKRRRESGKLQRDTIKNEVLSHYSKQTVGCAFCGEEEMEFLTIDHIENRKEAKHPSHYSGDHLYFWLKRNNFPTGYQVLCFNCNSAKEFMKKVNSLSLTPKNISERNRRKKLKIEVFLHYSWLVPKCACCGTYQINFLTMDHIHGRKVNDNASNLKSRDLYAYLKKSGYPAGYQVLCWNCNFSKDSRKDFKGICIHKRCQ